VWCALNDESDTLARSITGAIEVAGAHDNDFKASAMMGFAAGKIRVLVTKPTICGFGMNFQNCHNVIFVGLSDSWEQYYQAVRRCWRFGQKRPVNCHIVTSASEGAVLQNVMRKSNDAKAMRAALVAAKAAIGATEVTQSESFKRTYQPTMEMETA
jgi:superfamily II DNA helicase RecQ